MSDRIRSVQESALRQSLIEVVAKALWEVESETPWELLGVQHRHSRQLTMLTAAAVVDALRVERGAFQRRRDGMHVPAYPAEKDAVALYRIGALEVG